MRAVVLSVLATTACADPVVELELRYADTPAFDLSCVSSVRVYALGNDAAAPVFADDYAVTCIDLPRQPGAFGDVVGMLRGRIDLEMPTSGLAAVELVGMTGSCANPVPGDTIFYGGAPYDGDALTLALTPNLSCNRTRSYTTRAVDFWETIASQQCTPASGLAFAATIRPLTLGAGFGTTTWEYGASAADTAADGTATLGSFVAAEGDSCVAIGVDAVDRGGGGCVNLGPSLCGATDELDVPVMSYVYRTSSLDDALYAAYGEPVIGAVFEAGAGASRLPLAGATIELADPTQGKVVYVQRGASKLEVLDGARATNADGLFMVYLRGPPTAITVTSAGHAARTYMIASAPLAPLTMFAVLEKL